MSILTKIRNRTGLLLTIVAGGIGLFIVQDGLTSLMEPIIMSFLGVVIGGLNIAMYLPIFSMGDAIGGK